MRRWVRGSGRQPQSWMPSKLCVLICVRRSGRGMEGSRQRVCFEGGDALNTAPLQEVCSYLHVAKCHYCARVGETLKYVAEQYNFDTNWLRLWNYNYQITDPVCPSRQEGVFRCASWRSRVVAVHRCAHRRLTCEWCLSTYAVL